MFAAFVSWPSAPLTESLVQKSLSTLDPRPNLIDSVPDCPDHPCLQWASYDEQDHERTHTYPDSVLASSYTIRKALIRKHFLHRCIHAYITKNPTSPLLPHVPRTWDLEISYADELDEMWADELWDLGDELDKHQTSRWWILKPGMADRGMGIRLFNTKGALQKIFESFEDSEHSQDGSDSVASEDEDTGIVVSQLRHFVIQEYLVHPVLFDPREVGGATVDSPQGHKFHLRAYCVASGDLKVYLSRQVLALFSNQPYLLPSADENDEVNLGPHLTNTCLQDEHDEKYVRLLDELVGSKILPYVGGNGQRLTTDDVDGILNQIAVVLAETFRAAVQMPVHFQSLPNAFELFGVDFLVTHSCTDAQLPTFSVKLLEINAEPAIEMTGHRLQWVLEKLFNDIGQICVKPFFSDDEEDSGNDSALKLCLRLDVHSRAP